MKLTNPVGGRSLGMLLLGVWLIITGLLPLLGTRASATVGLVLAVLALAAGALILIGR